MNADAIGLSALLVSTSKQMPLCVQELDRRGIQIPVLIGGAAINRRFGRRAMFLDGERAYDSGVFYCKDAFEGLETMDRLGVADDRAAYIQQLIDDARADKYLSTNVGKDTASGVTGGARSDTSTDNPIPSAPYFGTRVLNDIPLDEVYSLLDLNELYRLQWGGRGSGPEFEETVRKEFEPTLARLKASAKSRRLAPAEGDRMDCSPCKHAATISSSTTPTVTRKTAARRKSRAFISRDRKGVSVSASPIISVRSSRATSTSLHFRSSPSVTKRLRSFQTLQPAGEYTEAFYVHGIAVETAEAVAEWMHRTIRHELGVPAGQGKRYSWGYGACPDLEDHAQLFKILSSGGKAGLRHGIDERLPAHPGTEHRGDHRASSASEVLCGSR